MLNSISVRNFSQRRERVNFYQRESPLLAAKLASLRGEN